MNHVKNYNDYLDILKKEFIGLKEMPNDYEIRSFMHDYNLYQDWKIEGSEVRSDIRTFILNSRNKTDAINIKSDSKQKSDIRMHISGYKDYLIKLKRQFGIPKNIPENNMIEMFVYDYSLLDDWGITTDIVVKDLKAFIEGKYQEMLKDASPKRARSIYNSVKTSYKPLTPSKPTNYYLNTVQELNKSKKSKFVNKKDKNLKIEKTIFVDGDNHILEGTKGIEHTTKDIQVKAYFSQEGAKRRFDKKYSNRSNVSTKLVKPGNQAVDNQIKTDAGRVLQNGNQNVVIVSHDKGYDKYSNKKNGKNGNRIIRRKSIDKS